MSKADEPARHSAAIVYHYFAHYREPVVRHLCAQQTPLPEITLISGQSSNLPALVTIDPDLANIPVTNGGLRWKFVKNIWFSKNFLWQTGLIRLALSTKFDTIIFLGQRGFISTWLSVVLARMTGKRTLFWGHGFRHDRKGLRGLSNIWFQKLSNGLLLYGNWARQKALTKGFKDENLYVVFNSLDYLEQKKLRSQITKDEVTSIRSSYFAFPDRPLLLSVARITTPKRLDLLIDAVKLLADEGLNVNALILGDGPVRESLIEHAEKLGLGDQVKLPGACHDESKLACIFSAADLCVVPGAIGLTVMHSLVYGTPVITHDNPPDHGPEFEAVIPNKTGQFFEQENAQALAATVSDWLRSPRDQEKVQKDCHQLIDQFYNPAFQAQIINAAIQGVPANELPRGDGPYAN